LKKKPDPAAAAAAPDAVEVRARALKLLARREHSALELKRKLLQRGYPDGLIEAVLLTLTQENLLNETRYAGEWVRSRISRGQGPIKIRAELRQQGLAEAEIQQALAEAAVEWGPLAARVRAKRFGAAMPVDLAERARQARFLEARGFCAEHIREALRGGPD
jgi:regulatory protein